MKRGDLVRYLGTSGHPRLPERGELCLVVDVVELEDPGLVKEDGTPLPWAGHRIQVLISSGRCPWVRGRWLEVISEAG